MLTISEFLEQWNAIHAPRSLSRQRLLAYLKAGQVQGAEKGEPRGSSRVKPWLIPAERVQDFSPPERGKYARRPRKVKSE